MPTREEIIAELKKREIQAELDSRQQQPVSQSIMDRYEQIQTTAGQIRQGYQDTQKTLAAPILRAVEPAITMGTGLAASAVGGYLGAAEAVNPFSPEGSAEKTVRGVQEAFTYQPRSEAGQQGVKDFETAMQPFMEFIDKARSGDSTLKDTGSKVLATINEMFPEILASMFGGVGMRVKPPSAPKLKMAETGRIEPTLGKIDQRKSDLLNKPAEAQTAKFKLEDVVESGKVVGTKVVKDPVARQAIKQGVSEPIASMIRTVSKKERSVNYQEMVAIVKKKLQTADYDARPADVVGRDFETRVNHVQMVNKHSGGLLDKVAKTLKGERVDIAKPVSDFMNKLDEMAVTFEEGKAIFVGSDVEGLAGPIKLIEAMLKRIESLGDNPSAYRVHQFKRFIDEQVSFGKTAAGGLSGRSKGLIKSFRHDIDAVLDANFPKYNKVNTAYSDTIKVLDELQSAVCKIELSGEYVGDALGTKMRVLLVNTQNRTIYKKAIKDLEDIAIKYGGKYTTKMSTQMKFANELERLFGAMTETSLKADVAQAVTTGVTGLSGRQAIVGGLKATADAGKRLLVNREKLFKALEILLNQ